MREKREGKHKRNTQVLLTVVLEEDRVNPSHSVYRSVLWISNACLRCGYVDFGCDFSQASNQQYSKGIYALRRLVSMSSSFITVMTCDMYASALQILY